jgi:hypothetical protein
MRQKLRIALLILAAAIAPKLVFGATATPVTVSSIAVAGNTVTVTTSTAHNLSATLPSGFCLSAPASACGVVLTAPSGTTFTFSSSTVTACAASCGTVLPSKRVIWLNTTTVGGGWQVSYLLWIATTSGAVTGKNSSWSGASAAENTAISSGAFIEIPRTGFFPLGTSLANAETQMANDWLAQQNAQASSGVQPGQFLGNFYDGIGWLQ